MTFVFQQPGTSPLLDAIENCAATSDHLGAMFAFATKRGADLFINLPEVQALLARGGTVHLIVGLDAITNAETLLFFNEKEKELDGLKVRAYLHPWRGTFHPKYMWFVRGRQVKLIVGSGNLTPSGLGVSAASAPLGNWEAFLIQNLDENGSDHFLASMKQWLARASTDNHLRNVDDVQVLARGAENSRARFVGLSAEKSTPSDEPRSWTGEHQGTYASSPPSIVEWPLPPGAASRRNRVFPHVTNDSTRAPAASTSVPQQQPTTEPADSLDIAAQHGAFVREISRNRPGQADVGQEGLRFFGFDGNKASTVLLQHVDLNNTVSDPLERQLFVNASDNYRVEMAEIAQLPYEVGPHNERMILVAVQLDARTFRYAIVPIDHPSYDALSQFLSSQSRTRTGAMRKAFVHPQELEQAWPEGPSNLFPAPILATHEL